MDHEVIVFRPLCASVNRGFPFKRRRTTHKMGLFNDYLKATSRKPKSTKPDTTKPEAPTAPNMAETPNLITLDGGAPNAGVPPGRMLMKRPNPPSEPPEREQPVIIVPFVQQREIQNDSAAVVPVVTSSNPQSLSSITPAWNQRSTQCWSCPTRREVSTRVENHTHYHRDQHIHNHHTIVPANANNHALIPTLSITRQTHTLIKYVPNDPSPARWHPDPCPRPVQIQRLTGRAVLKNTTMRDFLLETLPAFGLSCERGNGIQQIFPMGNNVWGPGQIFEWGDGDAGAALGGTELGKGYPHHEMFIARWTNW